MAGGNDEVTVANPGGQSAGNVVTVNVAKQVTEYPDPTDRPDASAGWPGSSDKLATIHSLFGRRLEIRSFR